METTLDSWSLPMKKLVCLTTHSGSNIVNAAARLNWTRLSCFGHNLHLAITSSIKDEHRCSRAIGVCHKIVSAFSQSWKCKRELSNAQLRLKFKLVYCRFSRQHLTLCIVMPGHSRALRIVACAANAITSSNTISAYITK